MAFYDGGKDDGAPELSLLNLVDLMLVFAVGLMVALVSYYGLRDIMFDKEVVMIVKKPGQQEMEIVVKKPDSIERMRLTEQSLNGEGVRIGTAYRLKSGQIVYVPETEDASVVTPGGDRR